MSNVPRPLLCLFGFGLSSVALFGCSDKSTDTGDTATAAAHTASEASSERRRGVEYCEGTDEDGDGLIDEGCQRCDMEVTRPMTFWRDHVCVVDGDATGSEVLPITVGSFETFTTGASVRAALLTPLRGNRQLQLRQQLISAKLNVAFFAVGDVPWTDLTGDRTIENLQQVIDAADLAYDSGTDAERYRFTVLLATFNRSGERLALWFDDTCVAEPEICNGGDDDGDGVIDEACACIEECDAYDNDDDGDIDEDQDDTDGDGICDAIDTEECDGLDNDGDGETDEDQADSDGDGTCDSMDTEECDGLDNDGDGDVDEDQVDTDGDGTCDGVDPEECDGLDNDGDGQIDEGQIDTDEDGTCDALDSESCDGRDNDGDDLIDEDQSDADGDGTCDDIDPEECDGTDNDGDGEVDEDQADSDGDGTCDGLDAEDCDGLDNNGDGAVDEGMADSDGDGTCDDLDAEDCDGVDNDGDGEIDEDQADADGDGTCDSIDAEECDGADNDGDGAVDEGFDADDDGFADCMETCTVTIDFCSAADGLNVLDDGSAAVETYSSNPRWTAGFDGAVWIWDEALETSPGTHQIHSIFRSFDIPANGTNLSGSVSIGADNSYEAWLNGTGVGSDSTEFNYFAWSEDTWDVSAALNTGNNTFEFEIWNWAQPGGSAYSNPGGITYCAEVSYDYEMDAEACDGVDNDCDGEIDEGVPDSDGDGACDNLDDEDCDGLDNDGNGLIDDGLPDSDGDGTCDGLDSEECDGLDNDGDGATDEGLADSDGDGICDGLDSETCDGLDNDGDGEIDEGMSDSDGDGTCDSLDAEDCDGLDNDGDGAVDEDFDADGDGFSSCNASTCDVLVDLGHGEATWSNPYANAGAYHDWGPAMASLEGAGFLWDSLSTTITASALAGYEAVIIAEPVSGFSSSEVRVLLDYVDGGGGLLLITDFNEQHVNPISSNYGVEFLGYAGLIGWAGIEDWETDLTPVTAGVDSVFWAYGSTLDVASTDVTVLGSYSGVPVYAQLSSGDGRVVFSADNEIFSRYGFDEVYDPNPSADRDNEALWLNSMSWLANCDADLDCDDGDAGANPDAAETCDDGVDNNCDGVVDEGCAEACDGVDNNNNGVVDEDCPVQCEPEEVVCLTVDEAISLGTLSARSSSNGVGVILTNSGTDDICLDAQVLFTSDYSQAFTWGEEVDGTVLVAGGSHILYYGSWTTNNGVYQPYLGADSWWCVEAGQYVRGSATFDLYGELAPDGILEVLNGTHDADGDGREDHRDWTGSYGVASNYNVWSYQSTHNVLTVGKSASVSGDTVTVTLLVRNFGARAGSGTVTDLLPVGWELVSTPSGATVSSSGGQVQVAWNVTLSGSVAGASTYYTTTLDAEYVTYAMRRTSGEDSPQVSLGAAEVSHYDGQTWRIGSSTEAYVWDYDPNGDGIVECDGE